MAVSTLHLTNAYHETSGGIRTTYHALLDYAEAHERRMTLVVPGTIDRVEPRGRFARIIHVRAPRSPVADGRYHMILPHRFLPPGYGPLWRLLHDERPDVVEVCDKYSLSFFAGLIRRCRRPRPVLVGLSCERMDDNVEAFLGSGTAARRFARLVMGRIYIGMFDAHLANSEYTADELRRAMQPPHLRPVYVCPPGIDLTGFVDLGEVTATRRDLLQRCGERQATLLLYAGRLSPEKQVLWLPRIMSVLAARTPAVHLIVAGDGPLSHRLEREATLAAPGRIHLLGHVDSRRLQRLLRACDAFIHPNPREPFGIGPLEAMAARTPVIAPASGGLLAYAKDSNAWLSAPDALALAAAAAACLDSDAERYRRVAAGRKTAEQHAKNAAAARMFACYDGLAAAGQVSISPTSQRANTIDDLAKTPANVSAT